MNLMTMTMNSFQTSARTFGAAVCTVSSLLLAACGGGGGAVPDGPRFQATAVPVNGVKVDGIKDNSTGIVWAAQLGGSAGEEPTAQELLVMADLGADTLASTFNLVSNKLVRAVEPVQGSGGSATWLVDFGAHQLGALSDEPPADNPVVQWRILQRPQVSPGDFYDLGNGTAYRRGLIWSICTVGTQYDGWTGQCTGEATYHSLDQAQAEARKTRIGGYADWRLPTKAELQGMLSLGNTQGSLLPAPFANKDRLDTNRLDTNLGLQYWTSSSSTASTPPQLWIVDFSFEKDLGGVLLIEPYETSPQDPTRALVRLVREDR
jgi:hypothetical protein